jgi:hypothetical protein
MIEFKEINGILCRMVEQPCHHCGQPEIIAEPVKEGSKEWALWLMMQGNYVIHEGLNPCNIYCGMVTWLDSPESKHLTMQSLDKWLLYCPFNNGWQLYGPQPKPLLADAKVADLVKLETGKWHTIKTIVQQHESCLDFLVYGLDNGRYYAPNGNGMRTDNPRIVEWQPLAPEGTVEWAWQMMLLGNKVTDMNTVYWRIDNLVIWKNPEAIGNIAQTPNCWIAEKASTGWRLYEPEPFANVKVGDYLGLSNGKPVKVANVTTIANQHDMVIDTLDGKFWGYYWFSGKPICCANPPITRILKPEEVKVKISLEGTVEKRKDNRFAFNLVSGITNSAIHYDMLDPATADLVRELIAKQEEEK